MAANIHDQRAAFLDWMKPLAADKYPPEEVTFISQRSEDQPDRSRGEDSLSQMLSLTKEKKAAGKGIKTRRRRSLSTIVHPPLGNDDDDEAYPPLEHIYPPLDHQMEGFGFPTSETFFYLRYQESSGQVGGPNKYLPSSVGGQSGSGGVDGALAVLVLAICGMMYLLFRKRSCFVNCGWKDDDPSDAVRASRSHDMV